ncbi:MAG TPA: transposase [Blastocatellia bacterium]|nr:transposase [Blastocatellia bacterium]
MPKKGELCPLTGSLDYHPSTEELTMIIFSETAAGLKGFMAQSGLGELARGMVLRMVVTFILHQGRMSCSQAAGSVASETIHRGELTRFLARPRWQKHDFNHPLRAALLRLESKRGKFVFLIDATLVSQAGKKTKNTYSTNNHNRGRRTKKRRYGQKKIVYKKCHSFTFGLLITPSGIRIPFQIPHYTREYCAERGLTHRTTAEAAAEMIRTLPLPPAAEVVVIGDTAYDSEVVQKVCQEKGYIWICPANPERVYEGSKGQRPQVRSRLKEWNRLSLSTIRLRASTGQYAGYRRLSKWRVGPKLKPRVYYAHQERAEVRSVGRVQLIFSTMKPNLKAATPDDVKILMTNALHLSVREVIELYSLRWQIELFFKELKSTLGFDQYSFQRFEAVKAWVETAVTTVLFLEHERATRMRDRRLSREARRWWASQRLHGLCAAIRQECRQQELKYVSQRLKTSGGIAKLQRLITAAIPPEFRTPA